MKLKKLKLLQNKLYLVGNADTNFKKGLKNETIFENLPLIFREKGSGTRQTMESFIANNNIKVLKKMELASNEAVKQAVLAGLGYSIMPLIGIKNELQSKELQIIPVKGLPIKTTWSLVWLKGKSHTPVSVSFLEHLKKEMDSIVHDKFTWYEQY